MSSTPPKCISSKEEVQNFLNELFCILSSKNFNLESDLDILPKKKSENPTDPYTTQNTMLDLSYDKEDVRDRLLELTVANYSETVIDDKDTTLPPFYAFFVNIDHKVVYIKVKIRSRERLKVFCVSFHYARYPKPKLAYEQ